MNMRNSKRQETWFCRHLGSVNHTSDAYFEVNYSDALLGILVLLNCYHVEFLVILFTICNGASTFLS